MLSLAHFVLTSGISQFQVSCPRMSEFYQFLLKTGALGLEFQQEWSFNEAPRVKRIRTSSCCRRTVGCRIRTTVLWSQKLRTVEHAIVRFNHA